MVTHEEHRVERVVERGHGRRAAPRLPAHDIDLGIDLVEHEVAQHLDAVVLLDDELGRARRARAGDRRVHVRGHPDARSLVVLTAGDDVGPTRDAADAFHVDRHEDAHGRTLLHLPDALRVRDEVRRVEHDEQPLARFPRRRGTGRLRASRHSPSHSMRAAAAAPTTSGSARTLGPDHREVVGAHDLRS